MRRTQRGPGKPDAQATAFPPTLTPPPWIRIRASADGAHHLPLSDARWATAGTTLKGVESPAAYGSGSRDKDASAEEDTASVGSLIGARGTGNAVAVSGSCAVDGDFEVACPFVGGVEGELVGGGFGGL